MDMKKKYDVDILWSGRFMEYHITIQHSKEYIERKRKVPNWLILCNL